MGIPTFLVLALAFVEALPTIIQVVEQQRRMSAHSILRKRRGDGLVPPKYLILDKIFERLAFIERITQETNKDCFKNLRMSTAAFKALCIVLKEECDLLEDHYVSIVEKVSIFLHILEHHQKNRVLQTDFQRSGQTVSKVFNEVLRAVIKLRHRVIANPVPVDETTTDKRFKWFKGYLGALDGTYVPLHIIAQDQARYRTRKGHLATNVVEKLNKVTKTGALFAEMESYKELTFAMRIKIVDHLVMHEGQLHIWDILDANGKESFV